MRDEDLELRLMQWGAAVSVGDGSGYPCINVIHPNWTPPSRGLTPALKVRPGGDVRRMHRAIGTLPIKQRNAIVLAYAMRLSVAEQCQRLECSERVRQDRLRAAKITLMVRLEGFCNIRVCDTV